MGVEHGGTAVDTSVSFARQQQGGQTVAGVGVVFRYSHKKWADINCQQGLILSGSLSSTITYELEVFAFEQHIPMYCHTLWDKHLWSPEDESLWLWWSPGNLVELWTQTFKLNRRIIRGVPLTFHLTPPASGNCSITLKCLSNHWMDLNEICYKSSNPNRMYFTIFCYLLIHHILPSWVHFFIFS